MLNLVEELVGFEPTIRVLQTRALPLGYSSLNPVERPVQVHEYSAADLIVAGAPNPLDTQPSVGFRSRRCYSSSRAVLLIIVSGGISSAYSPWS